MKARNLLAEISCEFFKYKEVYTYRMQKISDMSDEELITY